MRNLEFKLDLEGQGIVNFDANDYQKWILSKMMHTKLNDNVKVGKKFFFEKESVDEEGNPVKEYQFIPFIDANSIRKQLFGKAIDAYIAKHTELFLDQAATWQNIVRGWVVTGQDKDTVARKGAICITDFLLNGDKKNNPNIVIGTSDSIDPTTSKRSETSMFFTEKLGETKWCGHGNIDISQLMFISASEEAGRAAVKPENLDNYADCLRNRFGDKFNGKIGYYRTGQSSVPEIGILLNEEMGAFIIRKVLESMLSLSINRAQSYAKTAKLQVRVLNSPFDNPEWIDIKTREDIENLKLENFDPQVVDVTKEEFDDFLAKKADIIEKIKTERENKENKEQ